MGTWWRSDQQELLPEHASQLCHNNNMHSLHLTHIQKVSISEHLGFFFTRIAKKIITWMVPPYFWFCDENNWEKSDKKSQKKWRKKSKKVTIKSKKWRKKSKKWQKRHQKKAAFSPVAMGTLWSHVMKSRYEVTLWSHVMKSRYEVT